MQNEILKHAKELERDTNEIKDIVYNADGLAVGTYVFPRKSSEESEIFVQKISDVLELLKYHLNFVDRNKTELNTKQFVEYFSEFNKYIYSIGVLIYSIENYVDRYIMHYGEDEYTEAIEKYKHNIFCSYTECIESYQEYVTPILYGPYYD